MEHGKQAASYSDVMQGVGAVVLAAGYSSRMGAFKPLLPLAEGKTVLDTVLDTAEEAGVRRIIVVTGYRHEEVERHLAHRHVETAWNADFADGMFTSIQTGIRTLLSQYDATDCHWRGCFLLPVDCPLIGRQTLVKMGNVVTDQFAVPTYMGKKGHPLYVPFCHWQDILDHDGTRGLKGVTDRYFEEMQRIPADNEGVLLDMDDRQGYEAVKQFQRCGSGPSLQELARGRRFLFIRHGQIQQHRDKILLGQTDVPLSETGRKQARSAGALLAATASQPVQHIYTSPLRRAVETAELVAVQYHKAICMTAGETEKKTMPITEPERIPVTDLQEMSLGDWDGQLLCEVKKKYPAQFALRGRHLFTFKIGNHSENFFDMQYRAVNALRQILREDASNEIVLVTHKGVIRALENRLKGKDVSDPWQPLGNGEIRVLGDKK